MMPDGPLLSDLVTRARNGDKRAWDRLVERCAPVVWSICRCAVFCAARKRSASSSGPETAHDGRLAPAEHRLCIAERDAALREAFATLLPQCQHLLAMLTADPPVSCAEVSATLGIAVANIAPFRRGCLDALCRYPGSAALISGEIRTS
jgi:hypothetical protein